MERREAAASRALHDEAAAVGLCRSAAVPGGALADGSQNRTSLRRNFRVCACTASSCRCRSWCLLVASVCLPAVLRGVGASGGRCRTTVTPQTRSLNAVPSPHGKAPLFGVSGYDVKTCMCKVQTPAFHASQLLPQSSASARSETERTRRFGSTRVRPLVDRARSTAWPQVLRGCKALAHADAGSTRKYQRNARSRAAGEAATCSGEMG